ncbi:hypothetical protein ACTXT7_014948 [Hymenolepis weldensis]
MSATLRGSSDSNNPSTLGVKTGRLDDLCSSFQENIVRSESVGAPQMIPRSSELVRIDGHYGKNSQWVRSVCTAAGPKDVTEMLNNKFLYRLRFLLSFVPQCSYQSISFIRLSGCLN